MDTFKHSHEPTQAQIDAGNYRKLHRRVAGMDIAIENPAGSVRSGIDPGGNRWESRMAYDYGYIKGSLGADGDHVDCFVGLDDSAEFAYLITTKTPPSFLEDDEQKVMLQFPDQISAVAAFLHHYDDPRFFGSISAMLINEFRSMVLDSDGELIKTFSGHDGRPGKVGGSQPDGHAHLIEQALIDHALPWRHLEFSPEAWDEEFPGGMVKTPIGEIKVGDSQHAKLCINNRHKYFGLIRPTLENPAYVISEIEPDDVIAGRRSRGEQVDRPAIIKFIRAFVDANGRHHGFCSVTVARDGLEVSVSSGPREIRRLARSVKAGAILNFGHPKPGETATPEGEDGSLFKAVSFGNLTAFDKESNRLFVICDFALMDALIGVAGEPFDYSPDLLTKSLAEGERWVTAHPNGEGSKGVPILIKEHPDGTASVIGGAGGKLNHLKLRGIKPQSEYRQALSEKAQAKREQRKHQIDADKASGVHEAKQEARRLLKEEVKKERQEFVKTVAEIAGWKPEEVAFDEEKHAGLSPGALEKARKDHEKELFKRAKGMVDLHRKKLIADADARAAAGLGEIPLQSADPDALSVADLQPMKEVSGAKLGFDAKYQERAEAEGLTPDEAKAEASDVTGGEEKPQPTPEQAEEKAHAKEEKAEFQQKIAHELDAFKAENPDVKPPSPKILSDAQQAAALLKAEKRLKLLETKARDANRELDAAPMVESKAHILEVSDSEVEEAARKQMEEDVRTEGARSFISALEKEGGEAKVAGHIGTGAFNALNAFSLTVGGDALIDRSVVDVLGVAGAASVLARRVATDMGGDADKVREAMEAYHVEHHEKRQAEAVEQANALHDAAGGIELPDAHTGMDLLAAQELNHKRREAVSEAQRILGQAHGEMQANAALVAALQGKSTDKLEVNMGAMDPEKAIVQLRAIGLQKGDYRLDEAGGNLVATVTGAGMERLAKPIDAEGMKRIRENMDIMEGKQDEDGWLPGGFARRPDLAMHVEPGVAERLAKPFASEDIEQSMRDYIGGRMADGDAMQDILADMQSADFIQKSGDSGAYFDALEKVAPLKAENGKMRPIDSLRESWEQMADEYVSDLGGDRAPIHKQTFDVDQKSVDALHRALTKTPEGVAAFKPIGDLSPQERNGLRNWWYANIAKEDPAAAEKRQALDAHLANEPEKESLDMFGETSVNPAWHEWSSKRDELSQDLKQSGLDWPRYVEMMGSPLRAIESVQDLVRSRISQDFAETHNKLNPGSPLKIGKTVIHNNLDHLDAVDPQARKARAEKERDLIDSLRDRVAGKYSSGSVKDKIVAAQEKQAAMEQSQLGFFSTEELEGEKTGGGSSPLGADERYTIGHAAEQKLAGMMSVVGQNFKPGQPTKLWAPSMNGKFAPQQRMLKMLLKNKRVMAALGVGSGKSSIQLGGFSHLHSQGLAKKGLILAPSVVQAQFGGEALRYLEPGKFKWHAEPGASREERIAAYKDPGTHFVVATHQSFRDDMIHLGAKTAGVSEKEMADKLQKMTGDQRNEWAKSVMQDHGINLDYMSVDESQYTLNRDGKENSRLSNVVDAFAHHSPYYMLASGDPIKNDSSEAHSMLQKLDPDRYADKDAFMRRYGGDTISAKEGLRRELARYVYASRITPDVKADRKTISVQLNDHQKSALAQLDKDVSAVKIAKMEGRVDMDAVKRLSPDAFKDQPEEKHGEIAKSLQDNAGLLRNAAVKRIINVHPQGAKLDKAAELAHVRRGKPGVIFAHSLELVDQLRQRLEADGHRVVTLTGADSSKDKDKKRLMFNPENGDAQADILIASDAAATGMNLQRGQWLMQMDTSDTAMTHAQRQGRILRTGQKNDVELLDLVADHESEHKARKRLEKKYGLRELMTSPLEGQDDTGLAWYLRQKLAKQQEQGGLF